MGTVSMREGEGHEVWRNGDEYRGNYSRDKFEGHGELTTKSSLYKGQFHENYKSGLGTILFKSGEIYPCEISLAIPSSAIIDLFSSMIYVSRKGKSQTKN